jgi:hypothetical protein
LEKSRTRGALELSGLATNAFVRLMVLRYHLFADGRVYSMEQLSDLLSCSSFKEIRFFQSLRLVHAEIMIDSCTAVIMPYIKILKPQRHKNKENFDEQVSVF